MQQLKIPTERGVLLDGVLFDVEGARPDTAVIAITGIHGNFYSNPFYVNFGETLNSGGVDFVYAQTCDAFGQIATMNAKTGERVVIGSQTEDFNDAVEDVRAYVDWAEQAGYERIYLGGHSLGANKVIRYLSETHDPRVERFILLSPANLTHMTSVTTERVPGKSEQGLLVALEDNARLWLAGDDGPVVGMRADAARNRGTLWRAHRDARRHGRPGPRPERLYDARGAVVAGSGGHRAI